MRSYLWFKSDGTFGGAHGHLGGFGPQDNLADPANTSPLTLELRGMMAQFNPAGWVAYDCPCPPADVHCSCCHHRVGDCYLDNGVIVKKPGIVGSGMDILINGKVANAHHILASDSPLNPVNLPPGSKANFQLSCPHIPDGHVVTLTPNGLVSLMLGPVDLTFSGGLTNIAELTAPAQGMIGYVSGMTKLVNQFNLFVRGWA